MYTDKRTKEKFDGSLFGGGLIFEKAYTWEKKYFNLKSVKLTFISFF